MTRVGIDLRIVHFARTGFHRWACGLVRALVRFPQAGIEPVLLLHPEDRVLAALAPGLERASVATPLFRPDEAAALAGELAPLHLDVLHFPFSLLPGRLAARTVLTVHDLTCRVMPGSIEDAYRPYYLDGLRRAAQADRVVATSARVAGELAAAGVPRARIRLCYPPTPFEDETLGAPAADADLTVHDRALAARLGGRPYLLSVGSLEPRKNHGALVAAFERVRARHTEPLALLLVGQHGWLDGPLLETIARSPYRDDVLVVRDAGDALLQALLRRCALYVCCSTYEGFGLPVLEALDAGACVLSTPVPSLVEAGFPDDGLLASTAPDALARRIASLLADPPARADLARRASAAAAGFYRACDPARLARLHAPEEP